MGNFDQTVRFKEGSDSGENDPSSTQPILGSETYHADVLNRPDENIRMRTEVVRAALEVLNYEADYDRSLTLTCAGTIVVTQVSAGKYSFTPTQDFWIHPTLTPGVASGGRAGGARLFISGVEGLGTPGVNDIHVTADRLYTGQRGYADGQTFAGGNVVSIGSNDASVQLIANAGLAGGPGSISCAITGTPVRHVALTWGTAGGGTQINDLIAFVNADRTSQGGLFGAADYIRMSTTSPGTSTSIPTCADTPLQGGYDAEGHRVSPAQFADFFTTVDNQLQDKEAVAIGFPVGPVEFGPEGGPKGGRRQSLYDLPVDRVGGTLNNTTPAAGNNLFNTGRTPEQIPGSIPICKVVNGSLVFIDGTVIVLPSGIGTPTAAISLGESDVTLARLASTSSGHEGALLVGYDAHGAWNADSGTHITATTVEGALDEVQNDLALMAGGNSGAKRIGAEAATGAASAGNFFVSLAAGSVRQQIAALMNTAGSDLSHPGGINARVSEWGHTLKGYSPIYKDLGAGSLAQPGGIMHEAQLSSTGALSNSIPTRTGRNEYVSLILQPIGISGVLQLAEPVALGSANDRLVFTDGSIGGRYTTIAHIIPNMQTWPESDDTNLALSPTVIVSMQGASGGTDGNGYYVFMTFTNSGTHEIHLQKLDGTVPDFSTTDLTTATIAFYNSMMLGNNAANNLLTLFHYGSGHNEYPAAVIGLPPNSTLLQIYQPNQSVVGGAAVLTADYLSDGAIWQPLAAFPRDTNNILSTGDFNLLKGVETGTPINATSGHIHDDRYVTISVGADSFDILGDARYVRISGGADDLDTLGDARYERLPGVGGSTFVADVETVGDARYLQCVPTPQATETFAIPDTAISLPSSGALTLFGGSVPSGWVNLVTVANLNITSPLNVSGTFTRKGMYFKGNLLLAIPTPGTGGAPLTAAGGGDRFQIKIEFAFDNNTANFSSFSWTPTLIFLPSASYAPASGFYYFDQWFEVVVPWTGAAGAATNLQAKLAVLSDEVGGSVAALEAFGTLSLYLKEDWQIRTA